MSFPRDTYPYTNFHELNLGYFIVHFREIFSQWANLYDQMTDWKDATDEELATWKADVEADLDQREAALRAELETWKAQTGQDIAGWEDATLAALTAWQTATQAVFEAIRTEAAASASAAAASAGDAATAKTAAETAQAAAEAAAASVQASAVQIATNTEDIADLKTQLNIIGVISEGNVSTANTWQNFPFKFELGKTYVFYNLSNTGTVSVRSRVNADEITGDAFGSFGPNTENVLTPTMNANYIRINSTVDNSEWKISEEGTEIYELNTKIDGINADISNLDNKKLDKSVWENDLEETVTQSGVYVNFPYMFEKNHTYEFSVLDKGNTISAYTRAGDTNIDTIGVVTYGSPKIFTASENANFIRINSYLSNGKFSVKDTNSASYEIDELKPKTPIVNLPSNIYAISGLELNIYFDNIVSNAENYKYNITCTKGKQMKRGFAFTPDDADAGTYDFVLDVLDNDGNIVKTAESTLIVTASTAGSGTTKTMILLGDSTVNGTDIQIVNDFIGDGMILTTLGTRGTAPALHEGRTGWSFQYYYNSASVLDVVNAFYNPSSHLFDADYYFANSGIAKPDWFFIQLGINDVFTITDNATLNTKISSMISQCNYMTASIKNASPATKIGIAITIPPNYSQDAFGKAYECGQTRDRYKYNNMKWVERLIEEYDDKENENIYLIPIFTNLDTIYNMGFEEQQVPVNARNEQFKYWQPIMNGSVHPVESGYMQLADVYMAFIKANA